MRPAPLIDLFVAGRAVSQPRAGRGRGGHTIMAPAKHAIRSWRQTMKMMAQQAMRGKVPVSGPVRLEILFLFRRPKRLLTPEWKDTQVLYDQDPDWDNVGKAVSDAFKGVLWNDDCQVTTVSLRKRFAMPAEAPGVVVRAYPDAIPWE